MMKRLMFGLGLMAFGWIGSQFTGNSSTSLAAKARRDDAIQIRKEDPDMLAAYRRGRETLPQFLNVSANKPAGSRAFAVKIPLRDGDKVEWFWIADFRDEGDQFSGRINNTPRFVTNVRNGETVHFARKDIVDWMYVVDGKLKGNFTACAIAAKQPEAEREKFLRTYNMTCSV